MPKATIIADLRYKRPGQGKPLHSLLKYLQHRDGSVRRDAYLRGEGYGDRSVSDYVTPGQRAARWVDRGMGETANQVLRKAQDWQSRSVLARTWVLSPDPELMWHIPEHQRLPVMQRVTEQTLALWYGDNGWGQPEYSYVIHDKSRAEDGAQMLHAHVITPGTIPVDGAEIGSRMSHVVKKPHLADLQHTSAAVFQAEMERVLGRGRAQEILLERDERLAAEAQARREARRKKEQGGLDRHRLARATNVLLLLRREQQRKKHKRQDRDERRRRRQRIEDLRIYSHTVCDQHWKQAAQARRERWAAQAASRREAREALQAAELAQARSQQAQQATRARVRQRPERQVERPSPDQLAAQEELRRQALLAYYANLFAFYDRQGPQLQPRLVDDDWGIRA